MPDFMIRPLTRIDKSQMDRISREYWGAEVVIAHGVIFRPSELPGFKAIQEDRLVGAVTYNIVNDGCEIVSLASLQPSTGVGAALIAAVREMAQRERLRRLWLITTNDNLNALRFYQKRGFELVAVHRHAVDKARKLKPEIPLIGENGIPLRDEIELEALL